MNDPLTYLDEVDALTVKLAAENWADCDGASVSRQGFIMADVPRLSKALRDVLEVHEPISAADYGMPDRGARLTQVCTGCGQDNGNWNYYPCPTVRAIQAALAVNGEGGTR